MVVVFTRIGSFILSNNSTKNMYLINKLNYLSKPNLDPPPYQESTTLREWSRGQSNRAVMSDGEQEPQQSMGVGRQQQMTSSASGTKRVHYAAATFTRASSLSGHMPTGQHHHTFAHQSASEESAGPPPPLASRSSRMVLARQTSVSTPTGSNTMASSLMKSALQQGKFNSS